VSRARAVAGATGLALLALWARVSTWPEAFVGRRLVPIDGDSLYHLRRMLAAAADLPHVPVMDPGLAWPVGAPCPWAPGFTFAGAVLVRAAGPRGILAAALFPVLLGLLCVGAAALLARALAPAEDRGAAALAAGIFAGLLPQSIAVARFGRIDHHVAEALAVALLTLWSLAPPAPGDQGARRRWAFEVAGALLTAGAVLVFSGAPLYVALAVAVRCALLVATPGRPPLVGSGAPALLAGGLLAALGSASTVAGHGHPLDFRFASYLQPALVLVAALGPALAVAVSGTAGTGRRLVRLGGVAAVSLALLFLAAPALAGEVVTGLRGWLLRRDPWLAHVQEFQPVASVAEVTELFAWIGLLAPVLVIGAVVAAREQGARAALFGLTAAAYGLLTLLQSRFGRVFGPLLAAAAGLALAGLARAARRPGPRRWAWAGGGALLLLLPDPRVYHRLLGDRPMPPSPAIEVAIQLPPPRGGEDAPGVLAQWDLGNEVLTIAHRPVVANGFGSYSDPVAFEELDAAFTMDEAPLVAWMDRRRLGWMIAGPGEAVPRAIAGKRRFPFVDGRLDLDALAATPGAASLLGGAGVPERAIPHLGRLRPVAATTTAFAGLRFHLPVLWVFQRVEGAVLEGRAAPGVRVTCRIGLAVHGVDHAWRGWTDAGPDGRFALRVPVPTGWQGGGIATGDRCLLEAGGAAVGEVPIPERAVHAGERIAVPAVGAAAGSARTP
jgi:hypothetical protein